MKLVKPISEPFSVFSPENDLKKSRPGLAALPGTNEPMKRKKLMKKRGWTFIKKACIGVMLSIGMLITFACQDELVAERQMPAGNEIAFALAKDSAWTAVLSRSAESTSSTVKESRRFLTVIGKDSVFLHTRVEENTPPAFSDAASSRAATRTTADLSSFYLHAFLDDGSEFMKNQLVVNKNGKWEYSPLKYWPNNKDAEVHFYGYAKTSIQVGEETPVVYPATSPEYTKQENGYQGTFSHILPTPNKDNRDAERQPDLIFAMAPNQSKQSINGAVQLKFYHALSAIVFKVGEMPVGTKITNLTIADVKESGNCTMTLATDGKIDFDWTPNGDSKTYTQAFNKENVKEGDFISEDATTFMMIPQTLTDESHLVIRFTIGQHNYEYEHPLIITDEEDNVLSSQWEPNKKYIYTLSTTEVVEVDVTDQVTGENQTVKEQVKIQNTGLTPSYIRAAIVGYWVNEGGDIVASWNTEDGVGTFTGLEGNTAWIEGADGFYYHEKVVNPGMYTDELFTRYELTGNPPIVGASLELNIVVQAVKSIPTTGWSVTESNGVLTSKQ